MATANFGTISVDPAVLIETAEMAFREIGTYQDGLEAAYKLIESTSEFWVGEGGDTFREIFRAEYAKAVEALEQYQNYPGELLEYAGLYSDVIANAGKIVDSVTEFTLA